MSARTRSRSERACFAKSAVSLSSFEITKPPAAADANRADARKLGPLDFSFETTATFFSGVTAREPAEETSCAETAVLASLLAELRRDDLAFGDAFEERRLDAAVDDRRDDDALDDALDDIPAATTTTSISLHQQQCRSLLNQGVLRWLLCLCTYALAPVQVAPHPHRSLQLLLLRRRHGS